MAHLFFLQILKVWLICYLYIYISFHFVDKIFDDISTRYELHGSFNGWERCFGLGFEFHHTRFFDGTNLGQEVNLFAVSNCCHLLGNFIN